MPVAKSFIDMEIVSKIYVVSGRQYVKVKNPKTGNERQVRWYSETEYAKLYPNEKNTTVQSTRSLKEVLGFDKGYITIFKGDTYSAIDWFRESCARYARYWGWYIVSTDEVPADLPSGVTALKLDWKIVSKNDELIPENEIRAIVDKMIFEDSPSTFVGNIGDRINLTAVVQKAIPFESRYGSGTTHVLQDANKNQYVWNTAARTLTVGQVYDLKGTVKDHSVFQNINQTILTRCIINIPKAQKGE